MQYDRVQCNIAELCVYIVLKLQLCSMLILIQFRNHEFDVCYLNITCKLRRCFRSDIVEISVTVTEHILWNMHTVHHLLCSIRKPISGLYFRVTSPPLLGQSYDGKSRHFPKASGATLNILCYVHQLDSQRTVITNFKKRTTENCAYFMRYHESQIYQYRRVY